jgi:outer membrane protein assembly factor BamB
LKRLVLVAAAMALLVAACSSGSKSDNPTVEGAAPTTSVSTSTPNTSSSWPTYHHDTARTGVADDQAAIGNVKKAWTSPALDGDVYAQPLAVGGHVIAATENNSVFAFDAAGGGQVWRVQLGAPVRGASLPCGNIDPSGITGTPVIDPASNTLYIVAFLAAATHHELFALDLASGATRWHRPIDPPGLTGRVEQQRGALTIDAGRVYVPYGALAGDCGPYKGAIVSTALDGQRDLTSYVVPTTRGAGIWQPGGPVVDSTGDVWAATANSATTGTFDYGNSIVRLSPDLQLRDYFAPTDWLKQSEDDLGFGSIGPAFVGTNRVLAAGKPGIAYLLDRGHLGNVGGAITSTQACGGVYGTAAVQGTTVFLPCTDGLVALSTDGDKLNQKWRRPGRAGPPIVAAGLVWDLDGNGNLVAVDPVTGQQRFATTVDRPASRFVSLSAAGGRVFVAPNDTLTAFALR